MSTEFDERYSGRVRLLNYRESSKMSSDEMIAYYRRHVPDDASFRAIYWSDVSTHHARIASVASDKAAKWSGIAAVFAVIAVVCLLLPLLVAGAS